MMLANKHRQFDQWKTCLNIAMVSTACCATIAAHIDPQITHTRARALAPVILYTPALSPPSPLTHLLSRLIRWRRFLLRVFEFSISHEQSAYLLLLLLLDRLSLWTSSVNSVAAVFFSNRDKMKIRVTLRRAAVQLERYNVSICSTTVLNTPQGVKNNYLSSKGEQFTAPRRFSLRCKLFSYVTKSS